MSRPILPSPPTAPDSSTPDSPATGIDTTNLLAGAAANGGSGADSAVPERIPSDQVRISMVRIITAWGFGAAFFNLTSGAIFTAFARAIGATDFAFGVLGAALPMMSFLQVLSAQLIRRTGRRKLTMLVAGISGRSLWVAASLLPLISRSYPHLVGPHQVLPLVIASVLLAGAFQAFTSPAFFTWMADLVPGRVRSTFLARRMQIGTFAALLVALGAGFIADCAGYVDDPHAAIRSVARLMAQFPPLDLYCVLLAIAGLCGVLDVALFAAVREPPAARVTATDDETSSFSPMALLNSLREPLRDPAVRRFLRFAGMLNFGYGIQAAFLWLHALEYLNLSKTATGLLLNIAPMLAMVTTVRFWARMTQRYGNRPVMRFCSAGLTLVPLAWLTARPGGSWGTLLPVLFLSGMMAGALELTNQNLITGLSPHIPRSTMTALFSIASGLSFAAASWMGGAVAGALHWMNDQNFEIFGLPFINYHVLFLCSLLARLINAAFFAPRLHEPEATKTLDAVKEVVPELIQSMASRINSPLAVPEVVQSVAARISHPFSTRDNSVD